MTASPDVNPPSTAATGVPGLDAILNGGLPRNELYLVEGGAGTGKTTFGLQFMLEGVRNGERCLYLTLSQSERGLTRIAESHGWSLEGIDILELGVELGAETQTLLHTADVELGETLAALRNAIERFDPIRVVFDSIVELRLLAGDQLHYRRQVMELRKFFVERTCTVLLLEHEAEPDQDNALAGLAGGVIRLEQSPPEYGDVRRRLRVVKMRGMAYHGGYHNFKISTGSLDVYPRLGTKLDSGVETQRTMKSGIEALDDLLGGGLEEGTATVLLGPTGVGKTTLAALFAYAAAQRGEKSALFLFDERPETLLQRHRGLNMDLGPFVESGLINLQQIDTAELSPGEFSQRVRGTVEEGAKVVMIDSISGYFHAMPQETLLVTQMHELLSYLSMRGVLSLLVVGQHGVVGSDIHGPLDVSYMSDTLLLLRHFEALGSLRKAISVVKKRYGNHEKTIREMRLTPEGIEIGEPIREFSGVLSGTPTFEGNYGALMGEADQD